MRNLFAQIALGVLGVLVSVSATPTKAQEIPVPASAQEQTQETYAQIGAYYIPMGVNQWGGPETQTLPESAARLVKIYHATQYFSYGVLPNGDQVLVIEAIVPYTWEEVNEIVQKETRNFRE